MHRNIRDIKRKLDTLTNKFDKAMQTLIKYENEDDCISVFPIRDEDQLWDIEKKIQADPEYSKKIVRIFG